MDSEQEVIHHFYHEHPLRWIPNYLVEESEWLIIRCYGCFRAISSREAVYGCDANCSSISYLHQDCAEMPRQIRHGVHPSHLLIQSSISYDSSNPCAVCEKGVYGLFYLCSEGCDIWIHLGCAGGWEAADDPETNVVVKRHPSHPRHELTLVSRKRGLCSFHCDACGTIEKGNSYICITCNYWIHESCAALPATADFPRHHSGHSLTLSFHPPHEYISYGYTCGICDGVLELRRWVYHCHLCRYVVHVKCATNTSPAPAPAADHRISNESRADDHKDIINGPIYDIYEEIIKPFVKIVGGDIFIPNEKEKEKETMSEKRQFHKHDHPLSFITFSSDDEEEEDDDDDDDSDNVPSLTLTCDACTLPIHQKSYDSGYMFCGECSYFLHLACFNLPSELSSLPLHPIKDHNLVLLQTSSKLMDWAICSVCRKLTNGLVYACLECTFKVDITCASLPCTMKHAGHHPQPHHYLNLDAVQSYEIYECSSCCDYKSKTLTLYSCDSCKFSMCLECVLLPASNKHKLEKHRLPLTFDAQANHPSDFYCGSCELRMHPRMWMYHCRDCDESFHPKCFPTTSGVYRNINFGRHDYYLKNVSTIYHHPRHPLRFQLITKKKHCDLCRGDVVYEHPGFQCAACNFVMCSYRCGRKHLDDSKTIE